MDIGGIASWCVGFIKVLNILELIWWQDLTSQCLNIFLHSLLPFSARIRRQENSLFDFPHLLGCAAYWSIQFEEWENEIVMLCNLHALLSHQAAILSTIKTSSNIYTNYKDSNTFVSCYEIRGVSRKHFLFSSSFSIVDKKKRLINYMLYKYGF